MIKCTEWCYNFFKKWYLGGVPVVAQQKQIWPASMRTRVRSLAFSGLRFWCGRELWYRSQTPLRLRSFLWLCCSPVATAPIWPLAWGPLTWELPYAVGVALKRPKKKKKWYLLYVLYIRNLCNHDTIFVTHMFQILVEVSLIILRGRKCYRGGFFWDMIDT